MNWYQISVRRAKINASRSHIISTCQCGKSRRSVCGKGVAVEKLSPLQALWVGGGWEKFGWKCICGGGCSRMWPGALCGTWSSVSQLRNWVSLEQKSFDSTRTDKLSQPECISTGDVFDNRWKGRRLCIHQWDSQVKSLKECYPNKPKSYGEGWGCCSLVDHLALFFESVSSGEASCHVTSAFKRTVCQKSEACLLAVWGSLWRGRPLAPWSLQVTVTVPRWPASVPPFLIHKRWSKCPVIERVSSSY
jgi:hypothetical protein